MWEHRPGRATQRSPATPVHPAGGGGVASSPLLVAPSMPPRVCSSLAPRQRAPGACSKMPSYYCASPKAGLQRVVHVAPKTVSVSLSE
jgi:hypothetical protein